MILIFSASGNGVRSPMEISLVRLWPPKVSSYINFKLFSLKRAISVVPPPMSAMTHPSSFSSSVRTAMPEARDSSAMSHTSRPALLQHLTIFLAEETAPVTI